MTGWIVGYALAGLVVAVLALREFAPFDSHGDRASTGGMGLLMGAAWPLVLTGWLLARIAEGNRRKRWTPPMPSALHSSSGRPPSVPPRDGCDHEWVEVTVHGDSHEQWMCSKVRRTPDRGGSPLTRSTGTPTDAQGGRT